PSTIRVGINREGRVILFQGAVDIGQGSNTVIAQICAEALGLDLNVFELVSADTDRTADAGKTSASRQTFVSGKAAELAGLDLRQKILASLNLHEPCQLTINNGKLAANGDEEQASLDLSTLPADDEGLVLVGEGTFDPPTSSLDENGQGVPYATFGYGAQLVMVEVDTDLGTVKVIEVMAAHDVGRVINPTLAEGQIEGGIAQGLGMALMEEFIPGRTNNLHDYLIPTFGDVPNIDIVLIEDPDTLGPFGAKGLGEHVLIPTAPAILNAIRHACGATVRQIPATPDRVLAVIKENQ
ncbi:MAG: xanthine dehydrogenase family protein molybdopterin-binding subunit, partial [Gammaproteobacteria bacterium]